MDCEDQRQERRRQIDTAPLIVETSSCGVHAAITAGSTSVVSAASGW